MNDFTKNALTQEIKSSWIFRYQNWYVKMIKRRGNKTAFFIVISALMLLLFVSTWFVVPFLTFGFFMAFTSIAGGFKERAWARKYNLLLPEVIQLVGQVFP